MRNQGSGFASATASAIESLTANVFAGSSTDADLRRIDTERGRGRCGVSPHDAERWITAIAEYLSLPVIAAVTPSPDGLGDVRLTLSDGSFVWIEVKAQTTKGFRELIQADWVRDETDTLRYLRAHEPAFSSLLSPWILDVLDVANPARQFGSMSLSDLWVADVGLMTDRGRRLDAGVKEPEHLRRFMECKYLLHVSNEGARIARLDRLRPVKHVLSGGSVELDIKRPSACEARVWVSAGSPPTRGNIDFIYYVGYRNSDVVGRHKLHDQALRTAEDLFVVS